MIKQLALRLAVTVAISKNGIKTKTFSFLTVNTQDIIVWELFTHEQT